MTDLFRQTTNQEILEGTLQRVVFHSPESGWTVARLEYQDGLHSTTVVGTLSGISEGETLRLYGQWVEDARYGRQFAIERFEKIPPSTVEGIERYLASGLVKGVGPVLAKRLVETFELDTLRILDEEPHKLHRVPGLGKTRVKALTKAWEDQHAMHEVMVFLQSHGVTAALAARIYGKYGQQSMQVVTENPYELARSVSGIGFHSADQIARALGLPADALQRIEAAILHALRQAADVGHCFLPRPRLFRNAQKLLEMEQPTTYDLTPALNSLVEHQQLILETEDAIVRVYLQRLYDLETRAAKALQRLVSVAPMAFPGNPEQGLREVAKHNQLQLAEAQEQTLRDMLEHKVMVLTGGPGTGKTTLVRTITELFDAVSLRVVLCAPTGRAAKRLAEATQREAWTLHRLLEWKPKGGGFLRNARNPLDGDLFIVDESSMVDLPLLHSLLDALPPQARLLLVGDVDQLPSVGPGTILEDIIAAQRIPTRVLNQVFRQDETSRIIENAHRIRGGQLPRFPPPGERGDFVFIERDDPEEVQRTLHTLVAERLPQSLQVDPRTDIQVLVPMNRGPLGTVELNRRLQQSLNPDGAAIANTNLRVGDKVMQVRNNYTLETFNGDIGFVESYDVSERCAEVHFEDRTVSYETADLSELSLAYVCTVHKSQGSEYPVVVFLLHSQHHIMLQRNLLYTAVTRAKRQVILLGQTQALSTALRLQRREKRYTRLAERLRQAIDAAPRQESTESRQQTRPADNA